MGFCLQNWYSDTLRASRSDVFVWWISRKMKWSRRVSGYINIIYLYPWVHIAADNFILLCCDIGISDIGRGEIVIIIKLNLVKL
jgi:hypothetical protein